MKGKYGSTSDKNNTTTNNTTGSMFGTKFHHYFQTITPQHHHPHFQRTSEEDITSRRSGGGGGEGGGVANAVSRTTSTTPPPQQQHHQHGDGATIEAIRRPRGRPPGSKNKPRPPVFITREPEPTMSPYILEIPVGADVVDTMNRFVRRGNIGLCVLSGNGTVANVTLRQPTNNTPPVTFHGRYDVLSLTATFQVQSSPSFPAPTNHVAISLAGPQGQIFGGEVVGPLMAASTVFIVAASFNHPTRHRLPIDEEQARNSVSGSGNENTHSSPPPQSSAGGGGNGGQVDSLFNCDVLWAPTPTRQSQPPSSY